MKLTIKETKVSSLTKYPGEEACTQVLHVAGLLTPRIAERLKIMEGCFTDEGVPRHLDCFPAPSITIDGADVACGETDFRATKVWKFRVKQPKSGGDNDVSLELSMRLHFAGDVPLFAWLDHQNGNPFTLGINARQMDLHFGGEEDGEEEEPEGEADPEAGTLAPARPAGGTHQAKKGKPDAR